MKRDLQELEDFLWKEFDVAKLRQERFNANDDTSYSRESQPGNFANENRAAIAEIAQAIVAVRREMRVEAYSAVQQAIEDEIENGTRRDVTVLKKMSIKNPSK